MECSSNWFCMFCLFFLMFLHFMNERKLCFSIYFVVFSHSRPMKERRHILEQNMKEIPNRIMFSEMEEIHVSSFFFTFIYLCACVQSVYFSIAGVGNDFIWCRRLFFFQNTIGFLLRVDSSFCTGHFRGCRQQGLYGQ